jgi:long-chain acyl-CoA synthetase
VVYNLSTLLETSATNFPDRVAVTFGDDRLTYAQINHSSNQIANVLASRGVQPGDKVALSCVNLPCFSVVYWGILKAGATVVPLNVLLKGPEVAFHLADCDAKAYFCYQGTRELPMAEAGYAGFLATDTCKHFFVITNATESDAPFEGTRAKPVQTMARAMAEQPTTFETVRTSEDDTAVILYTSGTTGQPKGAELRHRNMRDNAFSSAACFGSRTDRPDTYLGTLPLFHSFGQTVIQNTSAAYGGTMVLLPRFEARKALDLMIEERVTFMAGVPTMYWGLLGALDNTVDVASLAENLRLAVSGGSALPMEVHKEFERRFGITLLEGYGLSETSPVASFSERGKPARIGSIGVPIPGVEMSLLRPGEWEQVEWTPDAIGEIAIKGHNVMKGYLKRPGATREAIRDGWFRSGDLARRDKDGWYYIVDRSKDMIIRGGFNVYPREIEELLMTHPDVTLAAVVGIPHESHGEEIKAVVIRKPGASTTEADLAAWAKERLAAYKYPRLVEFVDTLPMTATGKILKRELTSNHVRNAAPDTLPPAAPAS